MENIKYERKRRDGVTMKRILSVFCMVGLVFGIVSAVNATSYITTIDFSGSAEYVDPSLGSQPAELLPSDLDSELWLLFDWVLSPLFSQLPPSKGKIDYTIDWNLPDRHTNYLWSIDTHFWYGFDPAGRTGSVNTSITRSLDLGKFAIVDDNSEIGLLENVIENLPDPGPFGPVSYESDGGFEKGKIYFGLYAAFFDLDPNLVTQPIYFGGQIDVNAQPIPNPEPATILLLGSGLLGLAGYGRKKLKK